MSNVAQALTALQDQRRKRAELGLLLAVTEEQRVQIQASIRESGIAQQPQGPLEHYGGGRPSHVPPGLLRRQVAQLQHLHPTAVTLVELRRSRAVGHPLGSGGPRWHRPLPWERRPGEAQPQSDEDSDDTKLYPSHVLEGTLQCAVEAQSLEPSRALEGGTKCQGRSVTSFNTHRSPDREGVGPSVDSSPSGKCVSNGIIHGRTYTWGSAGPTLQKPSELQEADDSELHVRDTRRWEQLFKAIHSQLHGPDDLYRHREAHLAPRQQHMVSEVQGRHIRERGPGTWQTICWRTRLDIEEHCRQAGEAGGQAMDKHMRANARDAALVYGGEANRMGHAELMAEMDRLRPGLHRSQPASWGRLLAMAKASEIDGMGDCAVQVLRAAVQMLILLAAARERVPDSELEPVACAVACWLFYAMRRQCWAQEMAPPPYKLSPAQLYEIAHTRATVPALPSEVAQNTKLAILTAYPAHEYLAWTVRCAILMPTHLLAWAQLARALSEHERAAVSRRIGSPRGSAGKREARADALEDALLLVAATQPSELAVRACITKGQNAVLREAEAGEAISNDAKPRGELPVREGRGATEQQQPGGEPDAGDERTRFECSNPTSRVAAAQPCHAQQGEVRQPQRERLPQQRGEPQQAGEHSRIGSAQRKPVEGAARGPGPPVQGRIAAEGCRWLEDLFFSCPCDVPEGFTADQLMFVHDTSRDALRLLARLGLLDAATLPGAASLEALRDLVANAQRLVPVMQAAWQRPGGAAERERAVAEVHGGRAARAELYWMARSSQLRLGTNSIKRATLNAAKGALLTNTFGRASIPLGPQSSSQPPSSERSSTPRGADLESLVVPVEMGAEGSTASLYLSRIEPFSDLRPDLEKAQPDSWGALLGMVKRIVKCRQDALAAAAREQGPAASQGGGSAPGATPQEEAIVQLGIYASLGLGVLLGVEADVRSLSLAPCVVAGIAYGSYLRGGGQALAAGAPSEGDACAAALAAGPERAACQAGFELFKALSHLPSPWQLDPEDSDSVEQEVEEVEKEGGDEADGGEGPGSRSVFPRLNPSARRQQQRLATFLTGCVRCCLARPALAGALAAAVQGRAGAAAGAGPGGAGPGELLDDVVRLAADLEANRGADRAVAHDAHAGLDPEQPIDAVEEEGSEEEGPESSDQAAGEIQPVDDVLRYITERMERMRLGNGVMEVGSAACEPGDGKLGGSAPPEPHVGPDARPLEVALGLLHLMRRPAQEGDSSDEEEEEEEETPEELMLLQKYPQAKPRRQRRLRPKVEAPSIVVAGAEVQALVCAVLSFLGRYTVDEQDREETRRALRLGPEDEVLPGNEMLLQPSFADAGAAAAAGRPHQQVGAPRPLRLSAAPGLVPREVNKKPWRDWNALITNAVVISATSKVRDLLPMLRKQLVERRQGAAFLRARGALGVQRALELVAQLRQEILGAKPRVAPAAGSTPAAPSGPRDLCCVSWEVDVGDAFAAVPGGQVAAMDRVNRVAMSAAFGEDVAASARSGVIFRPVVVETALCLAKTRKEEQDREKMERRYKKPVVNNVEIKHLRHSVAQLHALGLLLDAPGADTAGAGLGAEERGALREEMQAEFLVLECELGEPRRLVRPSGKAATSGQAASPTKVARLGGKKR